VRGTTRPSAAPTTTMPRSFGDFAVFAAPAVFLLLWSSGFVFAKLGLQYAEPLTHLAVRMTAVVAILAVIIAVTKPKWPTRVQASPSPAQSSCCLEISSSECTPGGVEREMKAVNSVAIGFEFRKKYIRARAWMYRINNRENDAQAGGYAGDAGDTDRVGRAQRSCCARCTVKISLRLRRIRLGRLERDFASNAIDLNLQPPFLGRFYRRHCFANRAKRRKGRNNQ
jgi:hypothetical protein